MAHWRATIHREGVPPRGTDYRCWADVEIAEDWLDTRLMETQVKAERENRWDDAEAIRDARDTGMDEWGKLSDSKVQTPETMIGTGPFVEALGINYGIEGCKCERQAGIDVATVLAFKSADVYEVLATARERADSAAACYEDAREEWRAQPDKVSAVPMWISMLKMAAEDAEQRRDRLLSDTRTAEGRAMSQRDAASRGQVRVCMPMGKDTSGCGIPARVVVQSAYYDSLDCNWCGKSDITRRLGD
jgi:hypothetical protein